MRFAKKMTKYCGLRLLLLALQFPFLLPGTPAFAQAAEAANPREPAAHRYRRPTVDDRIKVLAKSLDLSEAQQSAVKRILEKRQQETLRIRHDPSISGSTRIDQFRILQDRTVEEIRAVLSEEQKQKYDPFASRKIQQAPERSVEDWLKLTTPK